MSVGCFIKCIPYRRFAKDGIGVVHVVPNEPLVIEVHVPAGKGSRQPNIIQRWSGSVDCWCLTCLGSEGKCRSARAAAGPAPDSKRSECSVPVAILPHRTSREREVKTGWRLADSS